MALEPSDLDDYFGRIGYQGPREPTLATLRGIAFAHATAIPFENFDVLLGRGVGLDRDPLLDKLVRRRRGGYCFEHNSLLRDALEGLGFAVEGFAARVIWGRPAEAGWGPRSHMLLRVRLPEGDFLADAGFGGLTLTGPLRFEAGPEQETPHEPHRLVAADGEIELHARVEEGWMRLYRFAPVAQLPIDYEVANWFTATHPQGLFTNNLLMARPEPDRRYALLNRRFTERRRGEPAQRRELASEADLGEVLIRCFRLELPPADVAAAWERIRGK